MRFPLLRPRWIGLHLVAVLAVATCCGLGYWQYTRSQEPSRETVTNPAQDLSRATTLDRVLEPGEYLRTENANRAVKATGKFDADAQLLTPARSTKGEKGYDVIVPFVTGDGTALPVNRGWVDQSVDSPEDLAPPPEGEVTATGWIRPPQEDDGTAPMSTRDGRVARVSPSVLVNEWPYQLYDGYLTLADEPSGTPDTAGLQPQQAPPPDPPTKTTWNYKNLSYAAQWIVFAIAAVVFWVSLMRRERQAHRQRRDHPPVVGAS